MSDDFQLDEDEPSKFNGWKAATFGLIAVLVCACFVGVFIFSSSNVSGSPNFIDVSIIGPQKLGVNETGSYQAVIGVVGNYEFTWSITPDDNKTLLAPNGELCGLTFIVPTEAPYLLEVKVKNVDVGNFGYASLVVYDPYSSSTYYLSAPTSGYSYTLQADGLGWFRAVNCTDGVVSYSSTNATYVSYSAISSCSSGGVIRIGSPMTIPLLLIDQADITVESGFKGDLVVVSNLTFSSANEALVNLKVSGLKCGSVKFDVTAHSMSRINIDMCDVYALTSGIVFAGDGVGEIHEVTWSHSYLYHGINGGSLIAVTAPNTGNGQIYFDEDTISVYGTGTVNILSFDADGRMGPPIYFNHINLVVNTPPTQCNIVNLENCTVISPYNGGAVSWDESWIEIHAPTTLVKMNPSTQAQQTSISFTKTRFSNANTTCLFDADDYGGNKYLVFQNNILDGNAYTLYDTWEYMTDQQYCRIDISGNANWDLVTGGGRIASPWQTAGGFFNVLSFVQTHGAAAPTNLTTYEVCGGTYQLSVTGGTGVNMTIYDSLGTAIQTDIASCTMLPLRNEYKVYFVFTTAPTTYVTFNGGT